MNPKPRLIIGERTSSLTQSLVDAPNTFEDWQQSHQFGDPRYGSVS
jgi:hypothetical protein